MALDIAKLANVSFTDITADEIRAALNWADGVTDEEMQAIKTKFNEIAHQEDIKAALTENALFLVGLAKIILTA